MPTFRNLALLVPALALSACAVGPDWVPPRLAPATSGPFVSANAAGVDSSAEVPTDWWRLYRDPVLDGLVADALAANTDVRVAVARLARARAALREVSAERTPQIGLGSSAQFG